MSEPLTREAIVTVARRLISEVGFDQMSLRRLAKELGVTAPALYAHVDDKGDLVAALAETGFQELLARYAELETDDPLERMRAEIGAYVAQALDEPHIFRVMFHFPPHALNVPGAAIELPAASAAFESGLETVTRAVATGAVHPDRDPMMVAMTLWTTAHGLATVMLLGIPADAAGRAALQRHVVSAVLTGLAAPPEV